MFRKFGTDAMCGNKHFAVIALTLSSVRMLTDGATGRLITEPDSDKRSGKQVQLFQMVFFLRKQPSYIYFRIFAI